MARELRWLVTGLRTVAGVAVAVSGAGVSTPSKKEMTCAKQSAQVSVDWPLFRHTARLERVSSISASVSAVSSDSERGSFALYVPSTVLALSTV